MNEVKTVLSSLFYLHGHGVVNIFIVFDFPNNFSCIQRRIRAVLAEKDVQSWGRAEVVIKLIDHGCGVDDSVEAARNCGDFARSLRYLRQECPICTLEHPMSQVCVYLVLYTQHLCSLVCIMILIAKV